MNPNRRHFLSQAGLALAGSGFLVLLAACGDSDETTDPNGELSCSAAAISSNHGHALIVPFVDVDAGSDKTYSIQGQAAHDHQITLTAADFDALVAGQDVVVTSTDGAAHTHSVTLRCV